MDMVAVDQIHLNFNPKGLLVIDIAIGLMMLGVALELKVEDFKRIIASPKAPVIGMVAQFILLPFFSFLMTLIMKPHPSIALGMILVAACPGGNVSNIITYLAKGNVAVSISVTTCSTIAAIFTTPLNLALWGGLNPDTAKILKAVNIGPSDIFATIFLILGIPITIGMFISHQFPNIAEKIQKPFKIFSLVFFATIVVGALAANWENFINYVGRVMFAVFLQNLMALMLGYWFSRFLRLPEKDCRAISIEVGIQNSALGLVLVFTFFNGLGGMAIVAAWWGIWHIISGLTAAFIFSRKDKI
ncbi:MAG: bile acid:sodium symporter family protein [Desulfobacterales bacterium]|nr:bile acid:sodium symporter family protein [Desulfobacterales bacterium]